LPPKIARLSSSSPIELAYRLAGAKELAFKSV
jgi:hypothetical protein